MNNQFSNLTTPSKIEDAATIMERYNLNPLEELSRLAVEARERGDGLAVEAICKFLAPYVHPKLKSYDVQLASSVSEKEIVERLNKGRQRTAMLSSKKEVDFY